MPYSTSSFKITVLLVNNILHFYIRYVNSYFLGENLIISLFGIFVQLEYYLLHSIPSQMYCCEIYLDIIHTFIL